ncbi:MAG: aldehyde dehydrogenase family protein [Pirellulales bacterium]|nr:aldehyde dehydrogenase family protein [Pirellulales bacterium]
MPLNIAAHKVAPAIVVGCPSVLKPTSRTPLGARRHPLCHGRHNRAAPFDYSHTSGPALRRCSGYVEYRG